MLGYYLDKVEIYNWCALYSIWSTISYLVTCWAFSSASVEMKFKLGSDGPLAFSTIMEGQVAIACHSCGFQPPYKSHLRERERPVLCCANTKRYIKTGSFGKSLLQSKWSSWLKLDACGFSAYRFHPVSHTGSEQVSVILYPQKEMVHEDVYAVYLLRNVYKIRDIKRSWYITI